MALLPRDTAVTPAQTGFHNARATSHGKTGKATAEQKVNNQPATIMDVVISAVVIIAVLLTAIVSLDNRRTQQRDRLSNTLRTQIADLTARIESRSRAPNRNANGQSGDIHESASQTEIEEALGLLIETVRADQTAAPNDDNRPRPTR